VIQTLKQLLTENWKFQIFHAYFQLHLVFPGSFYHHIIFIEFHNKESLFTFCKITHRPLWCNCMSNLQNGISIIDHLLTTADTYRVTISQGFKCHSWAGTTVSRYPSVKMNIARPLQRRWSWGTLITQSSLNPHPASPRQCTSESHLPASSPQRCQ